MLPGRAALLGISLAIGGAGTLAEADVRPLRVCLEQGPTPLSSAAGGADARIAQAVADRLGRPLDPVWYDLEEDDDASTSAQVNALLAGGVCELVGGVALTQDALRPPLTKAYRMRLPDGTRRSVLLGKLIHSRPYRAIGYMVTVAAGAKPVAALDDLCGQRVLAEQGSLTGHLLLAYRGGVLRSDISEINPRTQDLFDLLAAGQGDAALVERQRFDAFRASHPRAALSDSGYRSQLRLNLGYLALDTEVVLMTQVDDAILHLTQGGELASITESYGLSYQSPGEPVLLPPLTNRLLAEP